jgi:hypothetical protein
MRKYSIEIMNEASGSIEHVFGRNNDLTTARGLYRRACALFPDRIVLLRDRARLLARSDRPETMPS